MTDQATGAEEAQRYFAYGSNLDAQRMIRRCSTATVVGAATLAGHRVVFAGRSQTWGGAVATLLPDPEASVAGLVWALGQADLEALDGFEGHPHSYRRRLVVVTLTGGALASAHTYIKEGAHEAAPTARYFNVILNAYRVLGFDEAALQRGLGGRVPLG